MTLMFGFLSAFLLILVAVSASVTAAEIETIYVVPFTHNDVGFDATPEQMAANSVQSIDDAIEQAAIDPRYRQRSTGASHNLRCGPCDSTKSIEGE